MYNVDHVLRVCCVRKFEHITEVACPAKLVFALTLHIATDLPRMHFENLFNRLNHLFDFRLLKESKNQGG